jgi:hypothetical protein
VPMISHSHVTALASGDAWLKKGANILLFGPSGSGKSHLGAARATASAPLQPVSSSALLATLSATPSRRRSSTLRPREIPQRGPCREASLTPSSSTRSDRPSLLSLTGHPTCRAAPRPEIGIERRRGN